MHSGIVSKATILFVRLIVNHAFVDGNKRIAAEALELFLRRNGYALQNSDESVLSLAHAVAVGIYDEAAVQAWITARAGHNMT
jgi:death-on-curing protein